MPRAKLTDTYLNALKPNGKDTWHYDTVLPGFVAIQRPKGTVSFRIHLTKNRSLPVGKFNPVNTASAARDAARTILREHTAEDLKLRPRKITLRAYIDDHYKPWFALRHATSKHLNNL